MKKYVTKIRDIVTTQKSANPAKKKNVKLFLEI